MHHRCPALGIPILQLLRPRAVPCWAHQIALAARSGLKKLSTVADSFAVSAPASRRARAIICATVFLRLSSMPFDSRQGAHAFDLWKTELSECGQVQFNVSLSRTSHCAQIHTKKPYYHNPNKQNPSACHAFDLWESLCAEKTVVRRTEIFARLSK